MANPFSKGWKYLMSSFDKKIDDNSDPKILVHQAMEHAKEQHQAITDQAANVIGQARQLEMEMSKKGTAIDETQGQIRQSLQMADQARAEGDTEKATRLEGQAEQLAGRLVTLESDLENTKTMHGQAVQNAEAAKAAVAESETRLKDTLAQQDQLLMQAQQAEMQEQTTQAAGQLAGQASSSAPSMDAIREKIEKRYTTALGRQELAEATGAGQNTAMVDARQLERESQGRSKLDEIRSQMGITAGGASSAALEQGTGDSAGSGTGSAAGAPAPDADEAVARSESNPSDPGAREGEADAASGDAGGDDPGSENPTLPRDTR